MTDQVKRIKGSSAYTRHYPSSPRLQMELFGGDTVKRDQIEKIIAQYRELSEKLEKERAFDGLASGRLASNVLYSFNIQPSSKLRRHLKKSGVHGSSGQAIASDWNNVYLDILKSFVGATSNRTQSATGGRED